MSGTAGDRLGPYELVARIGAGGMGEVWRARDTRLDRSVAVKILPADFAEDARLRIRFEREARTISQLDHPNICALYDVGENYLVMELLDGESLADRLDRGPLPLAEVTRFGAQIADALDRAHRAGVVHRDVKPGNVMIAKSGAKLLDFGLAKSVVVNAEDPDKTLQRPLTSKGIVVGTLQYMAPEQIGGHEADTRTDIFALGAVLYEIVTGRVAFEGVTRTSIIAAIVTGQPKPIPELQPLVPPALVHLIAKCLSKDPEERWQSAHDVAEQLRWIGSTPAVPVEPLPRKSHERWVWLAVVVACLAVAAWALLRPRETSDVLEAAIAFDGNDGIEALTSGPPALSPDGKWIVYAARKPNGPQTLWLRSVEQGTTRVIEGTTGATAPFWSPDGRFLGFSAFDGGLKKIAVTGGPVELLARGGWGWSWSRDDVILYSVGLVDNAIHRIHATRGDPARVLGARDIGADGVLFPFVLPDGTTSWSTPAAARSRGRGRRASGRRRSTEAKSRGS